MKTINLFVLMFVPVVLYAQSDDIIRTITEDIVSGENRDRYEEVYNDLIEIYNSKIRINDCTKEQLQKLLFLNDFQIEIILEYRNSVDKIYSVFEFIYLIGFDISDCKRLSYFIDLSSGKNKRRFFAHGNLILSMLFKNNNSNTGGLPFSIKVKGKSDIGRLKTGFLAENDKGEPFFSSCNGRGFDFYSAYLSVDINNKILKKIYLGDYHLTFGNGLNMWTSYTLSKTSETVTVIPRSYGIKSYSSSGENRFLRGVALSGDFAKFKVDMFLSYKDIDASVDSTGLIKTVYNDGIHISDLQIDAKDAVEEMICGANIMLSEKWYSVGVLTSSLLYMNADYIDTERSGTDRKTVSSIYGKAYLKSVSFSGEFAIDKNSEYAYNIITRANMFDGIILAALFRDYTDSYESIYSSSFSEGSDIVNERGFYMGAEISIIKNVKIGAYYDIFMFKNPGYNFNTSLTGDEFLLSGRYENLKSEYRVQYRFNRKDKRFQHNSRFVHKPYDKHVFTFRYRKIINRYFTNTLSCGLSSYSDISLTNNRGFYMYNDLSYKHDKFRLSLRLAIFDVNEWNTRLYAYEAAPLYNFSTNVYYGEGTRIYLNGWLLLMDNLDFWFKFASTSYFYKDLSSDITNGDKEFNDKFDVRLQLRYRF